MDWRWNWREPGGGVTGKAGPKSLVYLNAIWFMCEVYEVPVWYHLSLQPVR